MQIMGLQPQAAIGICVFSFSIVFDVEVCLL